MRPMPAGTLTTMVCTTSQDVDKNIVAAVQRILKAPGSAVSVDRITEIRIYKALANGTQDTTKANVWTYSAGAGPDGRRGAAGLRPGRLSAGTPAPGTTAPTRIPSACRSATSTHSSPRSRR